MENLFRDCIWEKPFVRYSNAEIVRYPSRYAENAPTRSNTHRFFRRFLRSFRFQNLSNGFQSEESEVFGKIRFSVLVFGVYSEQSETFGFGIQDSRLPLPHSEGENLSDGEVLLFQEFQHSSENPFRFGRVSFPDGFGTFGFRGIERKARSRERSVSGFHGSVGRFARKKEHARWNLRSVHARGREGNVRIPVSRNETVRHLSEVFENGFQHRQCQKCGRNGFRIHFQFEDDERLRTYDSSDHTVGCERFVEREERGDFRRFHGSFQRVAERCLIFHRRFRLTEPFRRVFVPILPFSFLRSFRVLRVSFGACRFSNRNRTGSKNPKKTSRVRLCVCRFRVRVGGWRWFSTRGRPPVPFRRASCIRFPLSKAVSFVIIRTVPKFWKKTACARRRRTRRVREPL